MGQPHSCVYIKRISRFAPRMKHPSVDGKNLFVGDYVWDMGIGIVEEHGRQKVTAKRSFQ